MVRRVVMFDAENFKSFVGPTSAVSYTSGLKRIEAIYHTNIDEELQIDKCANLLNMLKERKRDMSLSDTERKSASDMHSHLMKYVSFKQSTNNSADKKLVEIISLYKDNFARINKEERYKWEAIHTYKKVWNIDAPNFSSMLNSAFTDSSNLLRAGNYYPLKMLITFSENEPETVRSLFKILYDETLSFEERFTAFRNGFDSYYKPQNLNSYQDLHAISVYLTFEYPEKYFIYKYRVFKEFMKAVPYNWGNIDTMSDVEKFNLTISVCDKVLEFVLHDDELKKISQERLNENCYEDAAFHLLALDIVYFGSKLTTNENNDENLNSETSTKEEKSTMKYYSISKNTILYGPPGTGKTYNTVRYSVAIIENKSLSEISAEKYDDVLERYNQYKADGLIEFTTFHQSYGYEEFIEGIKPVKNEDTDDASNIQYDILPGLFKRFCEKANSPVIKQQKNDIGLNKTPSVWKVSLWSTGDNPTRTECLENGHIRIGWDNYGPNITAETDFSETGGKNALNSFIYKMKVGDIIFSCYSNTTIDAIGIVTGDYEWCGEQFDDGLNRMRKVNWIVKGINEDIVDINGGSTMTLSTVYKMKVSPADAISLIEKHLPATVQVDKKQNYVFIIDEINRGNISKIFGELITLIEPTKRIGQKEGMKIKLPYSQTMFGVPDNVYLLGTMNTADRSIATIDTALRRRFRFKEILPDENVLDGIVVDGVIIKDMLRRINNRISVLYDREHTIGHSYFLPLKESQTIETLATIFSDDIIPLLQEYFYEDYEKICLVLCDNKSISNDEKFIIAKPVDYNELFGSAEGFDDTYSYEINNNAFLNINAYRKI